MIIGFGGKWSGGCQARCRPGEERPRAGDAKDAKVSSKGFANLWLACLIFSANPLALRLPLANVEVNRLSKPGFCIRCKIHRVWIGS
jgi:hypothetical protein